MAYVLLVALVRAILCVNLCSMDTNNALVRLDILILRRMKNRLFGYAGELPEWTSMLGFEVLDNGLFFTHDHMPLGDFLSKAEGCWKDETHSSKISEFFSFADKNLESLLFQVTAFSADKNDINELFLLIEKIDQESDLRVVGLQKSREVMLSDELSQQLLAEKTLRLKQEEESKKQILKLLDSLEEKNRELASFATIVAHDLVGPLATLSMHADAFVRQAKLESDSSLVSKAVSVRKSGERISNFVNSILDYAKMPEREITKRKVDLQLLIEGVLAVLEKSILENDAKITVGKMPHILANETLLFQMFQNLISNALSHKHADRRPKIHISSKYLSDMQLEILIEDNGQGIAPEERDRIFGLFERGQNAASGRSLGIGLATCKKIARLHEAEIHVESVLGEKSMFSIIFPHTLVS